MQASICLVDVFTQPCELEKLIGKGVSCDYRYSRLQAPASKASCDSCSALMFLVKESLVMEKENRRSCSISYDPTTDGAGPCITWCEGMEARSALLHRSIKFKSHKDWEKNQGIDASAKPAQASKDGRPAGHSRRHRRKDEKGREKQAQARDTSSHLSAHWIITRHIVRAFARLVLKIQKFTCRCILT